MSKFRIWVDDNNLDKVMGFSQFDEDAQRMAGFTGGTPASSIRVNTALRQANLVACALMNIVDTGNTADFRSPVATVQSLLSNYIANSMVAYKATNADVNNLNTNSNAVVNFKIGNGTAYNKTINNVANASNATNVNVTNKNTGDNAVVNFQLGNGTEFNKTVNNVQNSNKVQNQDLSSSNQISFGDGYILQRKKILWSGNYTVGSNGGSITLDQGTYAVGDTIEITWRRTSSYPGSGNRVERFKVTEFSTSGEDMALMALDFYGKNYVYIGSAALFTVANNQINFNSFRLCSLEGTETKGTTIKTGVGFTTANFDVTEIAKIF